MTVKSDQAVAVLRRAITEMLLNTNMSEWKTDKERSALRAMEFALADTETLEPCMAEVKLHEIREVMWPHDNPDESWSADTLDEIADIVQPPSMLTQEEETQVIEQSSQSYAPRSSVEEDANTASTEELEAASDILDKAKDNG